MLKVKIGSTYIKSRLVEVSSFAEASKLCREFIETNDCVAGCGSSDNVWNGGDVLENGKKVASISYNGRIWDLNGKEII